MTQYAVCHLQKGEKSGGSTSSLTTHIERQTKNGKPFIPANADPLLTHLNRELIKFPDGVYNRTSAISQRIKDANLVRKVGKNQSTHICMILSGTHEQMMKLMAEGRLNEWVDANLKWARDTFGKDNIVSAVLHMDEKTPHLHITIVPIVAEERKRREREGKAKNKTKSGNRLAADEVMARYKLRQYQDSYGIAMKPFGLERGIVGSKAHHKTATQHMREEEVNLQTNIEKLLDECVAQQEELDTLTDKKHQLEEEKSKLEVDVAKQRKEKKATQAGFAAKVMNAFGAGDLAKANATIEEKNKEIDKLKKTIVAWQKKYKTDSASWEKEKQSLMQDRRSYIKLMDSNSQLNDKYVNERYERATLRDNIDMLLDQFNSPTLAPMPS